MGVMSYKEFKGLISKLNERDKTRKSDIMMYLVIPFLQSLGYDVHDLDEVDLDMEECTVKIFNKNKVNTLITLDSENDVNHEKGLEDEDVKVYMDFGITNMEINLFYRVLDKWEKIETIDLEEDNPEKYVSKFTKRVMKEQFNREIATNGTRFLTESVLNEKLEENEWENDFLKYGLLKEITTPSDDFIKLMAKRLAEDYTNKDVEWIEEKLAGAKEKGFIRVIATIIKENPTALEDVEENEDEQEENIFREEQVIEYEENDVKRDERVGDLTEIVEEGLESEDTTETREIEDIGFTREKEEKGEGFTSINDVLEGTEEDEDDDGTEDFQKLLNEES